MSAVLKTDRINVVGTSGSGKSTVSNALAEKLSHPLVQLDQLFWRPNWNTASGEEMKELLVENLGQSSWVLDGNFNKYEPIKWENVQTVVWVDMPFLLTLWQVTTRCLRRAISQEEIWPGTGCRESFRRSFFSRESVIWWMITTFRSYRKTYEEYIESNKFPHIHWVRLRSRSDIKEFLNRV